ncbi:MAG: VOC family protein [Acidimicrobiales bacterium]
MTLATVDMARATSFYDALGFVRSHGGPTADFTTYCVGDGYLNLQVDPRRPHPAGWGRVIVWVDDVDAMYRRASGAGMAPSSAPEDAPWGERYFHLRDPDDHELSFAKRLSDERGASLAAAHE